MRKFLMVAAVLALAACGEKKAGEGMESTEPPASEMAPAAAAADTGAMKMDTTTVKPDTTTME